MICSNCGVKPKNLRLKHDGTPALPYRWVKDDDGNIRCSNCRQDDPVVNWSFRACPPFQGRAEVERQMWVAKCYRNHLVELERTRRDKINQLLRDRCPELYRVEHDLEVVNADIETICSAIASRNSAARKRQIDPDQREQLTAAKARRKQLAAQRKELRVELFADAQIKAALADIDQANKVAQKAAYNDVPGALSRVHPDRPPVPDLYWGNKGAVLASTGNLRQGSPPRFHAAGRRDRIAVQCQGGLTIADALAGTSRLLQIRMTARPVDGRRDGRRGHWADVWFRVGSTDDGAPIWTVVPVAIHRQPPPTALIKWAYLLRERVGTIYAWRLVLSIQFSAAGQHDDWAASGVVGVDLGWRRRNQESVNGQKEYDLRVGYWLGSDGERGEILLPRDLTWLVEKATSLASIRGRCFDSAIADLWRFVDGFTGQLPEWFRQRLPANRQWRSQQKFQAFMHQWRQNRFVGDDDAFAVLWGGQMIGDDGKTRYTGGYRQWRHLIDWEANLLRKFDAKRTQLYRSLVKRLRQRYHTVVLEDMDLTEKLLRKPGPTQPETAGTVEVATVLRRQARMAAVGMLRRFFQEGMAETLWAESAWTTRRHAAPDCGHLNRTANLARSLDLVCERCQRRIDQDWNAALNLLAAHASGKVVSKKPGTARKSEPAGV